MPGRSWLGTGAETLRLALRRLLLLLLVSDLLDGQHDVRPLLAEPLEVEVLDEDGQGGLPGFLAMVVDLPELLRVHPQLTRHLHMGVREVTQLPGVDPGLELIGNSSAGRLLGLVWHVWREIVP